MSYTGQLSGRQRGAAVGLTLLALIAAGGVLLSGLTFHIVHRTQEGIEAIALPQPTPPHTVPKPAQTANVHKSGADSAANRHAEAAPVVAFKPELPPPQPSPVPTAPHPGTGPDASAGATLHPGTGSGAGGSGSGTGAGGAGSGIGGGSKAAWRSGTIRDSDYPRDAARANIGGEVEVRFTIDANGRASRCHVTRSSGTASLDATTCRLIEERFRFTPATNGAGEPVASSYGWRQNWWLEKRR